MSLYVVDELFRLVHGDTARGDAVDGALTAKQKAAGGPPLRAYFGAKKLGETAELVPNAYLWVPLKATRDGFEPAVTPEGHNSFWGRRHHWQIRCYGATYEVASVMLENVVAVLFDLLEGADFDMVGETWSEALDGEAPVSDGELLIGEFTVTGTFAKRYVHVGQRVHRAGQVPVVVPAPTTQPTGFEVRTYSLPGGATDDELAAVDVVPVPPT